MELTLHQESKLLELRGPTYLEAFGIRGRYLLDIWVGDRTNQSPLLKDSFK